MTTDAIADVIAAITTAAGMDDHVTSHVLRHTFGTELTRSGVDIAIVAELMGHASLETTRLYTNSRNCISRARNRRSAGHGRVGIAFRASGRRQCDQASLQSPPV